MSSSVKVLVSFPRSLADCILGLISDFTHTRLRLPRTYCLCIVSSLFIISQVTAIAVSSVETLWIATLLLGLAYGSLFGSYPAIMIEWFGLGRSTFPRLRTSNAPTRSRHQVTFPKTVDTSFSRPSSAVTSSPSCLGATWTPMRQRRTCDGRWWRVSGR